MAGMAVQSLHASVPSTFAAANLAPAGPRLHQTPRIPVQYRQPVNGTRRSPELRPYKDLYIDRWTPKIFSVIQDGPSGGFVCYGITPRNELYVDRTGNRADVADLVEEILPNDGCRFVAYKFRYRVGNTERTKVIWMVWTPESVSSNESTLYLNGLAGALIRLNCPGTIPIIEAKSAADVTFDTMIRQVRPGAPSVSSSQLSKTDPSGAADSLRTQSDSNSDDTDSSKS